MDNINNIENNIETIEKKSLPKKNTSIPPKKRILFLGLSLILLLISSIMGCRIGTKIRCEQERLASINKEDLHLETIINTTDDIGDGLYQLNWKELTAILSVEKNNYTENIKSDDIRRISALFVDEDSSRIKNFDDVVNELDFTKKEKERAYKYLNDLEYHGYTPERLAPESPQSLFINSIKDGAIKNYKSSKILPSIIIAQAILESNWGESNLTKEANNLFGIKADYYWKGEYVTFDTNEYHNHMIKDRFRKYESLDDSIDDHSNFLLENKRYLENGVFEAKTYKRQAQALENAGYSTAEDEHGNKTYAKMLCQLIRQYNLQIIDSKVAIN